METVPKLLKVRLTTFLIVVITVFFLFLVYLFNLQVRLSSLFFKKGQQNCLRIEKVASPRGNITDAHGVLIATNRPITSIYWQGTGNRCCNPEQESLITALHTTLELSEETIECMRRAEFYNNKILVAHDVPLEKLTLLIEQFSTHKNLCVHKYFKRYYPHAHIASHLVGYLGKFNIDTTGQMGLERLFEEILKGQPGELAKTVNSVGKYLKEEEIKKALAGGTIETTIDMNLQSLAEEFFPTDCSGACIILNPRTGAIETLISRPSFDPTIFLDSIDHTTWNTLQTQRCFVNRAFSSYPPASLFKVVTLTAALETKIVTPNTCWYCPGYYRFAGRDYHCAHQEGHGVLNLEQALALSCNIPFFDMARHLKIDTIADYAHRLGLGQETHVLFPEAKGLIPTTTWKRAVKREPWWPGDTLSVAVGQSYLLATPIQIARMYSAICEGYLVRPRILKNEPLDISPLLISPKTQAFLKRTLKQVVLQGTGRSMSRLHGFDIYLKTGTAQTSDLSKRDQGKRFVEHGWVTLYFKYKNEEPHTLVIIVENIGSSSSATAIAYKILRKYHLSHAPSQPQQTTISNDA